MRKNRINIVIIFISFILLGGYILLSSDVFNSKNIIVDGNKYLEQDEIIGISGIRTDKNILMYNIEEIENRIEENKYIESTSINITLPDTINISIIEKDICAVLRNEKNYAYIDSNAEFIDSIDTQKDEIKNEIIIDVEYKIEKNEIIKYENEKHKEQITKLLKNINNNKLDNVIDTILIKDNYIELYIDENMKFILNNTNNIEYDTKRISEITLDLKSKSIESGTIDLTNNEYSIYSPNTK